MSGVITQLGAVGKQDTETFISPDQTFWKDEHKKHTQFAMEPKQIEFQGSTGYSKTTSALIPRNGDLIAKIWLVINVGALDNGAGGARFVDDLGRYIAETIRLEIGSVTFDTMYPEHEHAKEELNVLDELQPKELTGKSESEAELTERAKNAQTLYIPLTFDFCKTWGKALPIIALHLTDVKVFVKLRAKADLIKSTTAGAYVVTADDATINEMYLLAETVFLDDAERDWFADTQHKYVITQNQTLGVTSVVAGVREHKIDLTLNHPCKYIMFMVRTDANKTAQEYFNFSGQETGQLAGEGFKLAGIKLNGNDRLDKIGPLYWRVMQPLQHFKRKPRKHIYVYSFALKSDENSGTLNFSRIDNAKLIIEYTTALPAAQEVLVFTENINVATVGQGVMLIKYAS